MNMIIEGIERKSRGEKRAHGDKQGRVDTGVQHRQNIQVSPMNTTSEDQYTKRVQEMEGYKAAQHYIQININRDEHNS